MDNIGLQDSDVVIGFTGVLFLAGAPLLGWLSYPSTSTPNHGLHTQPVH